MGRSCSGSHLRQTSGSRSSSHDFADKLPTFHLMEVTDLGNRGQRACFVIRRASFFRLLLSLPNLGHSDLYTESGSGSQAHGSDFAASSTPHF